MFLTCADVQVVRNMDQALSVGMQPAVFGGSGFSTVVDDPVPSDSLGSLVGILKNNLN